jgi:hypothetical protein
MLGTLHWTYAFERNHAAASARQRRDRSSMRQMQAQRDGTLQAEEQSLQLQVHDRRQRRHHLKRFPQAHRLSCSGSRFGSLHRHDLLMRLWWIMGRWEVGRRRRRGNRSLLRLFRASRAGVDFFVGCWDDGESTHRVRNRPKSTARCLYSYASVQAATALRDRFRCGRVGRVSRDSSGTVRAMSLLSDATLPTMLPGR